MRILPILLMFVFALPAQADVVIPIASVEQFVNVRFSPDDKSEIVGRLARGEHMPYVRSVTGWHEVELFGGGTGFIHEDWCHVVARIPEPEDSVPTADNVADDNSPEPDSSDAATTPGVENGQDDAKEDDVVADLNILSRPS